MMMEKLIKVLNVEAEIKIMITIVAIRGDILNFWVFCL